MKKGAVSLSPPHTDQATDWLLTKRATAGAERAGHRLRTHSRVRVYKQYSVYSRKFHPSVIIPN